MKKFCLLVIMFFLVANISGCGKESETISVSSYQNYTLKEIDPEDFVLYSDVQPPLPTSTINPNWSPAGNYTYVLQSQPSNGYMSALIRVNSVNFEEGTAEVSYVLVKNEQDSEPVNSNGLITCTMTAADMSDGSRVISIRIDDSKSLEYSGFATSQNAYFINNDVRFRLKSES